MSHQKVLLIHQRAPLNSLEPPHSNEGLVHLACVVLDAIGSVHKLRLQEEVQKVVSVYKVENVNGAGSRWSKKSKSCQRSL